MANAAQTGGGGSDLGGGGDRGLGRGVAEAASTDRTGAAARRRRIAPRRTAGAGRRGPRAAPAIGVPRQRDGQGGDVRGGAARHLGRMAGVAGGDDPRGQGSHGRSQRHLGPGLCAGPARASRCWCILHFSSTTCPVVRHQRGAVRRPVHAGPGRAAFGERLALQLHFPDRQPSRGHLRVPRPGRPRTYCLPVTAPLVLAPWQLVRFRADTPRVNFGSVSIQISHATPDGLREYLPTVIVPRP